MLLDLASLEAQLDRTSVSRFALAHGMDAAQLNFCVNVDDAGRVLPLGTGLELQLAPLPSNAPPAKPSYLGVLVAAAPSAMIVVEPSDAPIPDAPDASAYIQVAPRVRVAVMGVHRGELSAEMRGRIEQSMVLSDGAARDFAPLGTTAVVLGTKLRRTDASFSAPGSGSWTLLSFGPGVFGHLAIDVTGGVAELRSKDRADATLGNALLRALR